MHLFVDVFGYCNLRCPSCPVGNWTGGEQVFTSGLMSEDLLRQILDKATSEAEVRDVALFNWTEPLLNPNLPRLIEVVHSYGINCTISSNLNALRDPDALMASNPQWLRVSVSGFQQKIYERGHREGDIEQVKANMRALADAKARTGSTTELQLYFHKYIDNEADEAPMAEYAESLGYRFDTGWAYFMPVDKVLTKLGEETEDAILGDQDEAVLRRLAVPVERMAEVARANKPERCDLLEDYLVIDVQGDVFLCCAASGHPSNKIGSYLDLSLEELQERKHRHSLCGSCMKHGVPILETHQSKSRTFDRIGRAERKRFAKSAH